MRCMMSSKKDTSRLVQYPKIKWVTYIKHVHNCPSKVIVARSFTQSGHGYLYKRLTNHSALASAMIIQLNSRDIVYLPGTTRLQRRNDLIHIITNQTKSCIGRILFNHYPSEIKDLSSQHTDVRYHMTYLDVMQLEHQQSWHPLRPVRLASPL